MAQRKGKNLDKEKKIFCQELIWHIRCLVKYWAELPNIKSCEERLDGLAFSILNIFDQTEVRVGGIIINDDIELHGCWGLEAKGAESTLPMS